MAAHDAQCGKIRVKKVKGIKSGHHLKPTKPKQWAGGLMRGLRRAAQRVAFCVQQVSGGKWFSCIIEWSLVVSGLDSELSSDCL